MPNLILINELIDWRHSIINELISEFGIKLTAISFQLTKLTEDFNQSTAIKFNLLGLQIELMQIDEIWNYYNSN